MNECLHVRHDMRRSPFWYNDADQGDLTNGDFQSHK